MKRDIDVAEENLSKINSFEKSEQELINEISKVYKGPSFKYFFGFLYGISVGITFTILTDSPIYFYIGYLFSLISVSGEFLYNIPNCKKDLIEMEKRKSLFKSDPQLFIKTYPEYRPQFDQCMEKLHAFRKDTA